MRTVAPVLATEVVYKLTILGSTSVAELYEAVLLIIILVIVLPTSLRLHVVRNYVTLTLRGG